MTESERLGVLVVDDDEPVLDTIEAVLSEEFDVVTTTSPMQALRMIDQRHFDVVCADYRMPGLNGIEVLQRVSMRSELTSCLLITGADEYFQKQEKSGYYVLLKPFAPERLVSMVLQLGKVAQMKRTVRTLGERHSTGRARAVKG